MVLPITMMLDQSEIMVLLLPGKKLVMLEEEKLWTLNEHSKSSHHSIL